MTITNVEPAAIPVGEPQPMIDPAKMPDRYACTLEGDCMAIRDSAPARPSLLPLWYVLIVHYLM